MGAGPESAKLLRLGTSWVKVLARQPESGMGYHVVSIFLKDGRRFDDVTIIDGTITSWPGEGPLPFVEDEIEKVEVTHGSAGSWTQRR